MPTRTCQRTHQDGADHHYVACNGDLYLCHSHHRGSTRASNKSKWAIDRPDECHTYCRAAALGSADTTGLWFIGERGAILGTRGERLAFFVKSPSPSVPWHGYPVGAQSPGRSAHTPPASVIDKWARDNRINRSIEDKLRRGIL